jgi:hypothetical protein
MLKFVAPGLSQFRAADKPEAFEMIFEVIAVLFLMQLANFIYRQIGRRHDVLNYVSRLEA